MTERVTRARWRLKEKPGLTVLVSIVVILALLAILGPVLWGVSSESTADPLQGISWDHLMGTDQLGRDIFLRTLVAARMSISLALLTSLLGGIAGTLIGVLVVTAPQAIRNVLLRVIDGGLAFPGIIVAIIVTSVIGVGAKGVVIGVAIAIIPSFARLASNLTISLMAEDYVANARVIGVSGKRIFFKYLLPGIGPAMITALSYEAGLSIVILASLSFVGIGVQLPQYDWGTLLQAGIAIMDYNIGAVIAPAVAIGLAGMVFALCGDMIADGDKKGFGVERRRRALLRTLGVGAAPAISSPERDVVAATDMRIMIPTAGRDGPRHVEVVKGIDLCIREGEIYGLVGESGSGKSMTASAIGALTPYPAVLSARQLRVGDIDLGQQSATSKPVRKMAEKLGFIFQDPLSSLNPLMSIGRQVIETSLIHRKSGRPQAWARAEALLQRMRIDKPALRMRQRPHELSGGMRQRIMIAMGLMLEPKLLIADEPTTALDVTTQSELLTLIRELRDQEGVAVLFISHDMGVINELCNRVGVMYAGEIVEEGGVADVLSHPKHPYTQRLILSIPTLSMERFTEFQTIPGVPPTAEEAMTGCSFAPRCPSRMPRCDAHKPNRTVQDGHAVACWLYEQPLQNDHHEQNRHT